MTELSTTNVDVVTLETAPTRYVEGGGIRFAYRRLGPSEMAMSALQRISITALTVLALGAAKAFAGQLPQYEVTGFPISPSQMSVIKPSVIQEQPSTPTLTLDGMPASPHQIAVIRRQQELANKLKTDASGTQHL